MKILISAYGCAPNRGSEGGAGYSIVRAAASIAECWVLTRANNVPDLRASLARNPTAHPVHLVPLEAHSWALRMKKRFGIVTFYNFVWQREALRRARELSISDGPFDVVHHATMSGFWMPMGVSRLKGPAQVIGPISGGTFTPPSLTRYLGTAGRLKDLLRKVSAALAIRLTRRRWRTATRVLCQNREMESFARRNLGLGAAPLVVHPHASEPPVDSTALGETSRRDKIALFAGRIVTWKGILLAIEAFELVADPHARLVFVGGGRDIGRLRRAATRSKVANRIDVKGPIPREELLRMMRSASCLLFPSFHDSAGFVVSESLSLGLPVVCLDHGGPGAITALWSTVPSVAVNVAARDEVVLALAKAVGSFIENPAPIPSSLVPADRKLTEVMVDVYRDAVGSQPDG